MKITAGLGSIDEYIPFVEAGADEFFCGYVPYSWSSRYGTLHPLNRREVLYYNVQLGAEQELKILGKMIRYYHAPVHLTFNSLYYLPEQYPLIAEIIQRCIDCGFDSFIIADPALILYLRHRHISCKIHLSGEIGELNRYSLSLFEKFSLKRIIFHRKTDITDIKTCIEHFNNGSFQPEFEAFILNELCHYTGAYCNSLHCDELTHICKVPYKIGKLKNTSPTFEQVTKRYGMEKEYCEVDQSEDKYLTGKSGCGLCALYRLHEAGITHVKLVGRGNYTDYMLRDIRQLKKALNILKNVPNETTFRTKMRSELFPQGCSRNCYYLL